MNIENSVNVDIIPRASLNHMVINRYVHNNSQGFQATLRTRAKGGNI